MIEHLNPLWEHTGVTQRSLTAKHFGERIDYYAVDLSFNRLYHGIKEFNSKHSQRISLAKADAHYLPFPNDSFDLVFTRHTLEQIPATFEKVLKEIFRISRGNVILFEPGYELGTITQKLKMVFSDYARGMRKYLNGCEDVELLDYYLMQNSSNPLNHTACFKISVSEKGKSRSTKRKQIDFACPVDHSPLEKVENYLYCSDCSRLYSVINSIPILDPRYSLYVTDPR